jgi:hypothetical protein
MYRDAYNGFDLGMKVPSGSYEIIYIKMKHILYVRVGHKKEDQLRIV